MIWEIFHVAARQKLKLSAMRESRRARLASKYSKNTAAQALGSFGFQIYDKSPCPQDLITFSLQNSLNVSQSRNGSTSN